MLNSASIAAIEGLELECNAGLELPAGALDVLLECLDELAGYTPSRCYLARGGLGGAQAGCGEVGAAGHGGAR